MPVLYFCLKEPRGSTHTKLQPYMGTEPKHSICSHLPTPWEGTSTTCGFCVKDWFKPVNQELFANVFLKKRQEYKFFHSHSLSSNFYWFLHCRVKATHLPCPPVLTALLLAIHQFVSLLPIPSHCSRNIFLYKQKKIGSLKYFIHQ